MDANPLPPLPCNAILFRAIIYESLVRGDGSHKPQTFIRRREADPSGLSVSATIEECKEGLPLGIFGIRTVHVGTLRDNGFDVFLDSSSHGNIRFIDGRLTPRRQDNEIQANDVAEVLMRCSRPLSYWNEENPDDRFNRELEQRRTAENSN